MNRKTWLAAAAAVFFCAGAHANPPPLEAYGRLPTIDDVSLSPDGKTLAFVRGDSTRRYLVVEPVGATKPTSVIDLGDEKLRQLQWADNTRVLVTSSVTTLPILLRGNPSEFFLAQYLDTTTNTLHRVLSVMDEDPSVTTMNAITGFPQPRVVDGHTVAFVPGMYFPNHKGRPALFRQDLTTGISSMVSRESDTNVEGWLIDEAGNVAAESGYHEATQQWALNVYRKGDPTKAIDVPSEIEGPDIMGQSEDGSGVVVRLPLTDEVPHYETISFSDGHTAPWHAGDIAFESLIQDERTGRVIGGLHTTDKHDYVFFNPRFELAWESVKDAFSNATDLKLVSWSDDHTKFVVLVFGPQYGASYFFVDLAAHKADPLGALYDGIGDVSQEKWIDYTAQDGRVIHAYLTLPMGHEARNLPLVVLPHGGPHSRDEPGFDWISQAIASRGYAVLQPQFRGSYGFGKDLLWAGFGEFGKKMQTDLSDGVRTLAAQGVIDPKRVCIVGGSYGGYAALAGATLDTGVYRCAVADAGLSDLHKQLWYWGHSYNAFDARGRRFWYRFLDVKNPDDVKLDAISPIKHVDKVTIPILLIHGKDDTVVPFEQSEDMADALKKAGKQVEFVKLDGEDHWLSRSATRLQMLEATIKFLEANNPPG